MYCTDTVIYHYSTKYIKLLSKAAFIRHCHSQRNVICCLRRSLPSFTSYRCCRRIATAIVSLLPSFCYCSRSPSTFTESSLLLIAPVICRLCRSFPPSYRYCRHFATAAVSFTAVVHSIIAAVNCSRPLPPLSFTTTIVRFRHCSLLPSYRYCRRSQNHCCC